jgi:hypothetical protein
MSIKLISLIASVSSKTLSRLTLGKMTFEILTLNITTSSEITPIIKSLFEMLSINNHNDAQNNVTLSVAYVASKFEIKH